MQAIFTRSAVWTLGCSSFPNGAIFPNRLGTYTGQEFLDFIDLFMDTVEKLYLIVPYTVFITLNEKIVVMMCE